MKKNKKIPNTEISEYSEHYLKLALAIEEAYDEEADLAIDVISIYGPDEVFEGAEKLQIESRIKQRPNPLVIALLKALQEDRLESYIKELKQYTGATSFLVDFENYPSLNLISSEDRKRIINQLKIGHEQNANKATELFFEKNEVPFNPIIFQLMLFKYELQFGYFTKKDVQNKISTFIDSLSKTEDWNLILQIKASPIFGKHVSKSIQCSILLKLMDNLDYRKIQPNENRFDLIDNLDNNPLELKVFRAYLDGTPIDDFIKSIEENTFDQNDINKFKKSRLFKIKSYYNKDDQARIIIKLTTGIDIKDTQQVLQKLDGYHRFMYIPLDLYDYSFLSTHGQRSSLDILKNLEKEGGPRLNRYMIASEALEQFEKDNSLPRSLHERLTHVIALLKSDETCCNVTTACQLLDLAKDLFSIYDQNVNSYQSSIKADVNKDILEELPRFNDTYSQWKLNFFNVATPQEKQAISNKFDSGQTTDEDLSISTTQSMFSNEFDDEVSSISVSSESSRSPSTQT